MEGLHNSSVQLFKHKAAQSLLARNRQQIKAKSLEEIEQQTEKLNKEIKESLNNAQSESKNLEEEMMGVEKMLTEKKNLDWNDKQKIQDKIQELLEKNKNVNITFFID